MDPSIEDWTLLGMAFMLGHTIACLGRQAPLTDRNVGKVVEVDDDMDELHRLDRGRILVKTSRPPLIQHKVSLWINGIEYTVHMTEEFCDNWDRCK